MNRLCMRAAVALAAVALTVALGGCGGKEKGKPARQDKPRADIPIDYKLRTALGDFAARPRVKGQFGLYVYDLTAGKLVYAHNQDKSIPTASCMKLLSGVAGLHLLGTRYKYATTVLTHGRMSGDTLVGDIVLRGSLDPQVQDADLRMFSRALRRKGIRHVTGRVITDLVIADPVKSEEHWYPWDLSFSKYGVFFKGAPRVRTMFRRALQADGIAVSEGQMVVAPTPRGSHAVFRFYRSIDRVIDRMWKNSSNTQATALLYAIGQRADPKGDPVAAGVDYLRHFLRHDLGQQAQNLVVHDACGLCTHNQLSPRALTAVLIYGWRHPDIREMLMRHLAIAGEDGTLRRLLSDPKLRGKIHGKTGTLSHPYGISSLAGFCRGSNGHDLAFTLMDSEMSVLDARVLQRDLCRLLVKEH